MQAYRKGIFSQSYVVEDGDDSLELKVSPWRESAEFDFGGEEYELRRESFSGAFVLELDGEVLARAEKRMLQGAFDVDIGDYACSLRKTSFLGSRFGLFEEEEQVGSIGRTGFFRSDVTADLDFIRPMPARVFVLWLALLLWKREEAAASGE